MGDDSSPRYKSPLRVAASKGIVKEQVKEIEREIERNEQKRLKKKSDTYGKSSKGTEPSDDLDEAAYNRIMSTDSDGLALVPIKPSIKLVPSETIKAAVSKFIESGTPGYDSIISLLGSLNQRTQGLFLMSVEENKERLQQIIETKEELENLGTINQGRMDKLNADLLKIIMQLLMKKIKEETPNTDVGIKAKEEQVAKLQKTIDLLTDLFGKVGTLSDNERDSQSGSKELVPATKKYMKYKLKYLKLKNELKNRS